jgi:putative peptidoglycan lipid II flippase
MNRILRRANAKLSVGWAAALLSGLSFVAMFLSLFRERLLNAKFGVESIELDAYRVAFTVPEFMFIILVSGALSVTFIPVLNERLSAGNRKSAWDMSSSLLNFMAILTFIAAILIIIFADLIVTHFTGMTDEGKELAITMMRIIAINPVLFAVSAILTSIQQTLGRFFFFALTPAIYNLGIIAGIVFLSPQYGIIGAAYGVAIGAVVQLLVAMVGMIGIGFKYRAKINWRNLGFKKVLSLLPYRSIDQGIDYFNNLVEISLASRLRQGMINAWSVAFTLHWVPINLIGVAISTAAFPQMSERINQGRPDLFKKEFISLLRVIIWLALPVSVIAYLGRGYLVRLLVAEGNYVISSLLGMLVIAIFFRAIFHLVSRSFYAQQDTKTPLVVSIVAITLNIVLATTFVMPWGLDLGVYGLALAQSIVAAFEVLTLIFILNRRMTNMFDFKFFKAMIFMFMSAFITAVFTYFVIKLLPLRASDVGFFVLTPKFGLIVVATFLFYVFVSRLFNLAEAKLVTNKLASFVFKPVKIQ